MYKMCKTEQSARRQQELEEGLLQAMGNCHYEQISVSDLCDRCGIPRKAFYRYFSGKDGALYALIDHTLLQYEGFQFDEPSVEMRSYQSDLEQFFRFWLRQKPLLDALKRSDISGVLVTRAIEHALSDVGMPIRFLPQQDRAARRHAIMFGVCGLMSMVLDWHDSGYDLSPREMSVIAAKLMTEPLFAQIDL
jgi:AcrR family transcriptional regulator